MGKQEEFVLRALEERDIRFVRLWFTDVLGFLKSVAVAPAELEGAFAEGIGFDGSAIEGFARVYESDMLAKPDPATFQILPWRGEAPGTARMFCDIVMPDGSPSYADPRHVLKRTLAKAADQGFTFYTHPEIEFFLLQGPPEAGAASRSRSTTAATSTTPPHGVGHDFRREAITMLESMGISVEFSHHEGGPGQQEIDLRYADALVDRRQHHDVPARHEGGRAEPGRLRDASCPSRSPTTRAPACTPTCRCSRATATPSSRPAREYQLSKTGRAFIAGLLQPRRPRSPRSPTSGSTPTSGWSAAARRRRTSAGATTTARALVRVPMYKPTKGQSTRVEVRTHRLRGNPYLAFAVMLAAG